MHAILVNCNMKIIISLLLQSPLIFFPNTHKTTFISKLSKENN